MSVPSAAVGQSEADLRDTYRQAVTAARKGQFSRSKALQESLNNYPLAPYVTYHRLSNSLGQVTPRQIDAFRQQYSQLPVTPLLYQRWLKVQGKRRQWQRLHDRRYATTNAELKCYFVRAQYGVGEKSAALDATSVLWSQPKSQPKACDPIFAVWRGTQRFTQDIVWQRFSGAMENREYVLARYLQRYLTGSKRTAAKAFYELRRQPQRLNWRGGFATDTAEHRSAISYGVRRLARRDAAKAETAWTKFQSSHRFSDNNRQMLNDHIVVGLAKDNRFPSVEQRDSLSSQFVVAGLVDAAIAHQQWAELQYWISQLEPAQLAKTRTRYWQARAQQQLGGAADFVSLASERNYYGFLAAAQIDATAKLQALPRYRMGADEETALLSIPGIRRAKELFAVGDNLNGRREWYQELDRQDAKTQRLLGYVARRMGKLFLTIQTANNADARDDLALRFPLAYSSAFNAVALRHSVDVNLLRAITRQESAFQPKAKSSAGAIGLMQVMPATAKLAMRRGNLSQVLGAGSGRVIEQDLLIPERNIEIGSYHLAWLLRRYDGQRPLAIAAYNAGESRVDRWLKKARSIPTDVWIETIPFKETRNYVQNVLAFNVVYQGLESLPQGVLQDDEWATPAG